VNVIRCGHNHCVDILVLLIKHLAEILVFPGIRVAPECTCSVLPVHIAKCDNIFAADACNVSAPPTADADTGYIELLARWFMTRPTQYVSWNNCKRGNRGCTTQKIAT
jgi:hypothetical protein